MNERQAQKSKFNMAIWQNSRPGNKFPVVSKRTQNQWHIILVGHAWAHWQSANKEGRALLARTRA